MKKFIFILLLLPMLAQAQIVDSVAIGDSTSSEMDAGRRNWFAALFLDQGISDSLKFKVSLDGDNFVYLAGIDSALYIIELDSSKANAVCLDPDYFYPFRYLQVESYDAIAKTKKAIKFLRDKRR